MSVDEIGANWAIFLIDWGSQGEDIGGERVGGKPAEAHILWYVFKATAGLSSCGGPHGLPRGGKHVIKT